MTRPPLRVVLATQNRHKVDELRGLLALHAPDLGPAVELVSLADLGIHDDVVEDGSDFSDNAIIKARHAHGRTGLWALADDSGLEVAALGGAPGIYSARYGGAPAPGQSRDARNREALLQALQAAPSAHPDGRDARFVCVLCLYGQPAGGPPVSVLRRGECRGDIIAGERGGGGFGYDPLFVPAPDELQAAGLAPALAGRTYAELSAEDKNRLSHRTRALVALLPDLRRLATA